MFDLTHTIYILNIAAWDGTFQQAASETIKAGYWPVQNQQHAKTLLLHFRLSYVLFGISIDEEDLSI